MTLVPRLSWVPSKTGTLSSMSVLVSWQVSQNCVESSFPGSLFKLVNALRSSLQLTLVPTTLGQVDEGGYLWVCRKFFLGSGGRGRIFGVIIMGCGPLSSYFKRQTSQTQAKAENRRDQRSCFGMSCFSFNLASRTLPQ